MNKTILALKKFIALIIERKAYTQQLENNLGWDNSEQDKKCLFEKTKVG